MNLDSEIVKHFNKTKSTISFLLENGHTESALILTYCWIDRMAWLSIPDEVSKGTHFKQWVNKYLLDNNALSCNADDLWAARNGLIHTGSAESKDTNSNKAKRIFYYRNNKVNVESKDDKCIFIDVAYLITCTMGATIEFIVETQTDPDKNSIAEEKLGKILTKQKF